MVIVFVRVGGNRNRKDDGNCNGNRKGKRNR